MSDFPANSNRGDEGNAPLMLPPHRAWMLATTKAVSTGGRAGPLSRQDPRPGLLQTVSATVEVRNLPDSTTFVPELPGPRNVMS